MFKSAFVPTGAIGLYSANYDILPQAVTNKSRYGNTYIFILSNHKIECLNGKPVALDVSLGNVSVQVNTQLRRRGRERRLLRRLQLPSPRVLPAQGQD